MQKYGFKSVYLFLLLAQILTSSTLPLIATTKALYFLYITLGFVNQGGHFVLFPAVCAHMYGRAKGAILFSILYSEFGLSALAAVLLQKYAVAEIGYLAMFYVLTLAGVVSFILSLTFYEVKPTPKALTKVLLTT